VKVVIIGGVTAGPKAASKIIRMKPDAEVVIIEKGVFLSYAGCGLPYYVSGESKSRKN
jgi:NADPH-dependent 2,4-dienoyl-CoA reductase/sulfur reductase-like enzyme